MLDRLTDFAARTGLPPGARWLVPLGAGLALVALLWGGWAVFDHFNDRDAVERAVTKANEKDLESTIEANDAASEERLSDDRRLNEAERSARDAIDTAEGGRPSAAAIALNCQRLRREGYADDQLPAPCGRGGADRGKAGADP